MKRTVKKLVVICILLVIAMSLQACKSNTKTDDVKDMEQATNPVQTTSAEDVAVTPVGTPTQGDETLSPDQSGTKEDESDDKSTPSASPTGEDTDIAPTNSPNLVLAIGNAPKDAEVLKSNKDPDGSYKLELLVDSSVTLTLRGFAKKNNDIEANLKADYTDASDISINDSADPVSNYPVQRASFTTDSKDGTRSHVYLLITTDTRDFIFDAAIPMDSLTEYQELVESWVSTLSIIKQ